MLTTLTSILKTFFTDPSTKDMLVLKGGQALEIYGFSSRDSYDIDFTIRNNCDSTIQLTPIDSKMWLTFNYNNRRYVEHIYTLGLWDNKVIEIPSNNEYHYSAFAHLFLGTSIQKKSGDYLLELIEVLPTLKIHYGDKNHILVSSEIKNVRVVKKGK